MNTLVNYNKNQTPPIGRMSNDRLLSGKVESNKSSLKCGP